MVNKILLKKGVQLRSSIPIHELNEIQTHIQKCSHIGICQFKCSKALNPHFVLNKISNPHTLYVPRIRVVLLYGGNNNNENLNTHSILHISRILFFEIMLHNFTFISIHI